MGLLGEFTNRSGSLEILHNSFHQVPLWLWSIRGYIEDYDWLIFFFQILDSLFKLFKRTLLMRSFMKKNRNINGVYPEPERTGILQKKYIRPLVLSIFSLGVITAFIYYLYANSDKYLNLLRLSPWSIILLLLLAFTSPFLNGAINTYMFRSLGAGLSHQEGFLLAAVSTLANQLPVSGGVVTKGFYLKRKYDISYAKYLSSMFALFFCTIAVYGFLGLIILIQWVIFMNFIAPSPLWIGFGGMASTLLIFWFPLNRIRIPKSLENWVQQALEGWSLISENSLLLLKLLGIQTTMMILLAIRYWLAFHMLSQNVTISQVLLFSSATILTNLVSFAPGGLGVREAVVGGIALALGFDPGTSVVAVGLDRVISTIMIMCMGWISGVILGRQISKVTSKPNEQDA